MEAKSQANGTPITSIHFVTVAECMSTPSPRNPSKVGSPGEINTTLI